MSDPILLDDWLDTIPPLAMNNAEEKAIFIGEMYARFMLDIFRMPAWKKIYYLEFLKGFKLFCTYEGKRYRVTGGSRFGDVWLTDNYEQHTGYTLRVGVEKCSAWSDNPEELSSAINITG